MKSSASSFSLVALISVLVLAGGQRLVFEDEFETFNLARWKHEITLGGGGNWEFQFYNNNRTNSYVRDGALYIEPTLMVNDIGEQALTNGFRMDVWGASPADLCTGNAFYGCERTSGAGGNILNPIKSARIRTAESFSFTYGKVEVRAKLPQGDWLWPAIWLLPRDNQYGGWPASGEIDIMESRGNPPSYPAGGYDTFGSTLHFGPSSDTNGWPNTHKTFKPDADLTKDFHVYGLIWNDSYIGTYFDDEKNIVLSHQINQSFWTLGGWHNTNRSNPWVGEHKSAPFNKRFYLIINLAVGGTNEYFPDNVGGKPWSNTSPHAVNEFWAARDTWYPTWTHPMVIDSVRVWSDTYTYISEFQANTSNSVQKSSCAFVMIIMCYLVHYITVQFA